MKKFFTSTIVQLLAGVIAGILLGTVANEQAMYVVVSVKHILGQLIFFMVPLIILGFVAPSIARLKNNVGGMLGIALLLAYTSSVAGGLFAAFVGYEAIPFLHVDTAGSTLKEIPAMLFQLDIPPVMSVISALVLALMLGISAVWIRSSVVQDLLESFQQMILLLVTRVLIPVLPFFIAANFCVLSYEGSIASQLPIFVSVILIAIVCHYIWLFVLYGLAGIYAGKNPLRVLKHYGPAYLTAVGTMSSAATLGVALQCAGKSDVLRKDVTDFSIPLFANVHLCGSVITEVFFVMTVSQVLYGVIPPLATMITFVFLLGIFAIAAPGVPGGTVMASLGIVLSVLGFDEAGTALLLTIFALQDSFGTACNVTGDGALSLALTGYANKKENDLIPE
ncbi:MULTISPECIES: dicarboxylate/amino acid:cation symporter [Macellibacteroides]|jgi:Na+/H+-dicarboxylate symporter|uniref:Na+/H+-dicarboxylate symporter n=2 Tax=root TaxID=1 RepID=A0A8E1ZTM2_9PORP|nr:dicarboxylate/amino acid:cation symporter [Macellibacteroides fermentans]MBP7871447.1 dicarboxylate/amino acid:cation symporter [Parabacteroides sp.]MDT3368842.1 dicarboxylate/amino acid:cation symporter [Bacteroidota bacterium]OCW93232.1 sodium:dicarboxylate symporter [Macellibacteroides sp. HH-ZS]HAD02933.1 dicarboxylate/amino acid:cation symporter [Porphyromonadaceae bacterium]MBP8011362.1 dicarboxylate/amino acid:cation symporter [Parabacteroides sp.]